MTRVKSERISSQVVFLKDGELVLRPVSEADAEIFQRWVCDPEVRQFAGQNWPMMLLNEKDWIQKLKDDNFNLILVLEVKGKPIGTMGLHRIDRNNGKATTGALIGEKQFWGKKYGQRAKKLLLKYAFEELRLNKINSSVIQYNERSINYSLRCGYKKEGRIREQFFRKGKYWDEIKLGITRKDWIALQK
jgi:RimJ/RimL family protein N-acetyltransferase